MDLKLLKHFVSVAENGGISAAARKLGLTQPALSRQIKTLEDELGVTLLDRNARSFTLTPAATTLLADSRKLLEFIHAMTQRVQAAANGLPLRVGYSPSLASDFLPAAIARFTQLHPNIRISLHDSSSLEMQRALLAGNLDLVVTVPCPSSDAIHWSELRQCGWRLAVSPHHPLASAKSIAPSDLNKERLLLYDREQYPDYWSRVTDYFKQHGIQAKVAGEFDGVTSLAAAVEANLGCAIMAGTSHLLNMDATRIVTLPIKPQPDPITIAAGVIARHNPPPHVLAFIEEIRI